jgi:hypothetical protein
MRWPPKKVIMAIVVIAIILLIWSGRSLRDASAEYLLDRVWIDRITDQPRELAEIVYLIDGHEYGVTGSRSHYRVSVELTKWSIEGDQLSLHRMQEDESSRYRVKTWRCEPGESPSEDLEYCMSLTGPNGTRKYFASDARDSGLRALILDRD